MSFARSSSFSETLFSKLVKASSAFAFSVESSKVFLLLTLFANSFMMPAKNLVIAFLSFSHYSNKRPEF